MNIQHIIRFCAIIALLSLTCTSSAIGQSRNKSTSARKSPAALNTSASSINQSPSTSRAVVAPVTEISPTNTSLTNLGTAVGQGAPVDLSSNVGSVGFDANRGNGYIETTNHNKSVGANFQIGALLGTFAPVQAENAMMPADGQCYPMGSFVDLVPAPQMVSGVLGSVYADALTVEVESKSGRKSKQPVAWRHEVVDTGRGKNGEPIEWKPVTRLLFDASGNIVMHKREMGVWISLQSYMAGRSAQGSAILSLASGSGAANGAMASAASNTIRELWGRETHTVCYRDLSGASDLAMQHNSFVCSLPKHLYSEHTRLKGDLLEKAFKRQQQVCHAIASQSPGQTNHAVVKK